MKANTADLQRNRAVLQSTDEGSAAGSLRLALLYNVVLVREFDFAALSHFPPFTKINSRPAVRLPKSMHEEFVAQARDLVPDPING